MNKLKKAHTKLDEALSIIDKACNILVEAGPKESKPYLKNLGMAIGEILETQKELRDDERFTSK